MMIEQRFSVGKSGGRARLLYKGQPCYLAGPSSHSIMEGYPDVEPKNLLKWSDGFNYVRHWCFEYAMVEYANNPANPEDQRKAARLRAYPFQYLDDVGKYDLTVLDKDYIAWLRDQLSKAQKNGVVVLISLFSNHDFRTPENGEKFGWEVCPWNPENNVNNGKNGKPVLFRPVPGKRPNDNWRQFIREPKPNLPQDILAIEEARQHAIMDYVNQMVAITGDFWNVFFEICNEPQAGAGINNEEFLPFCDLVARQIDRASGGKRMILYNPLGDCSDFVAWQNTPRLQNWKKVDGIIIHGHKDSPSKFDPETLPVKDAVFIQFSSDSYRKITNEKYGMDRDRPFFNALWTKHMVDVDVDFEAFTTVAAAAKAILQVEEKYRPTKLT